MTVTPEELYPWLVESPETPAAVPASVLLPTAAVPKLALSVGELGAAVGVSASTVNGWLRRGEAPPHLRLPGGRLLRFPIAAVEAWLLERAAVCEAVGTSEVNEQPTVSGQSSPHGSSAREPRPP